MYPEHHCLSRKLSLTVGSYWPAGLKPPLAVVYIIVFCAWDMMQEQHTNHVSNQKSKLGWVHECVYQQDAFDLETLSCFFGQCEFYKLLMFSNWRNSLFEGPQFLGGKGLEMLNLFVLRSSSFLQIFNVGRHKIHFPKFGQALTWIREALSSKSMSGFGRWQFLSDWGSWMGEALTGEDLNLWGVWTLGEVNFNFLNFWNWISCHLLSYQLLAGIYAFNIFFCLRCCQSLSTWQV